MIIVMGSIHKECKGCRWRPHCTVRPYYKNEISETVECPCSICLIKGICRDWMSCMPWHTYITNYHKGG